VADTKNSTWIGSNIRSVTKLFTLVFEQILANIWHLRYIAVEQVLERERAAFTQLLIVGISNKGNHLLQQELLAFLSKVSLFFVGVRSPRYTWCCTNYQRNPITIPLPETIPLDQALLKMTQRYSCSDFSTVIKQLPFGTRRNLPQSHGIKWALVRTCPTSPHKSVHRHYNTK
jgi:hypothetical protein